VGRGDPRRALISGEPRDRVEIDRSLVEELFELRFITDA
jgi:hypothetical protein